MLDDDGDERRGTLRRTVNHRAAAYAVHFRHRSYAAALRTKARPVDVRFVAATNRNLEEEVAQQRFRQDLYYRLRVIDICVPPLRERPEDLRALASELLSQAIKRLRSPIIGYAPSALDRILGYPWPGNIRELEHAIERACAVTAGPRIEVGDLPPSVRHAPVSCDGAAEHRPLRNTEREHILAVLARNQGDRRRTAEDLRISLSTLQRKLRRHGRPA